MSLIKKTSIFSDSRFPSFIRGNPEFDMLRRFIKSYFESLEEAGKPNYELLHAQENTDVDTVTSEFLDKFYSSLCPELPLNILADKRLLLKHSRELYQKKGTPDSFKLLFKILYNETINIKYPSENILRASDGKWSQTVAINVIFPQNVSDETIIGLVGQEMTVTKKSGIIRNVVIQIRRISYELKEYEITIDKQKNILFEIGDVLSIGGVSCSILPSTQSVKIIKQGRNFKIGQIIKLDMDDGTGKGSLAKITEVSSIGGIKAIRIIKFGTGYNADFNLTIFADLTGVSNVAAGDFEGGILPLNESTDGYKEYGVVSKVGSYGDVKDYFLQDYIVEDYISTPYSYFYGITQTSSTYNSSNDYFLEDYVLGDYTNVFNKNDIDAYAILSVKIGAVLNYPGFFANINGSLSNPLIRMQDNHLYQNFSYVIQSSISRDRFVGVVKNLLHPAGMLMFSDLLLENDIDVSHQLSDDSSMHVKMTINDNLVSDDLPRLDVGTKLASSFGFGQDTIHSNINIHNLDDVLPFEHEEYFKEDYVFGYTHTYYDITKAITQHRDDVINIDETIFKNESLLADTDEISFTDLTQLARVYALADNVSPVDDVYRSGAMNLDDVINVTEDMYKTLPVDLADTSTVMDSVSRGDLITKSDSLSTTDSVYRSESLNVADSTEIVENIHKNGSISFVDGTNIIDNMYTNRLLELEDSSTVIDGVYKTQSVPTDETLTIADNVYKTGAISEFDVVSTIDDTSKTGRIYESEVVSIIEDTSKNTEIPAYDSSDILDDVYKENSIPVTDDLSMTDDSYMDNEIGVIENVSITDNLDDLSKVYLLHDEVNIGDDVYSDIEITEYDNVGTSDELYRDESIGVSENVSIIEDVYKTTETSASDIVGITDNLDDLSKVVTLNDTLSTTEDLVFDGAINVIETIDAVEAVYKDGSMTTSDVVTTPEIAAYGQAQYVIDDYYGPAGIDGVIIKTT